jgi:predicted RNase H-like nuclease (RuvC/YqgF family)
MRLAKVADGTIKEDSSAPLQKHITELQMSEKGLQRVVEQWTEDYDLVVSGNKKLASKCDQLKTRCEGLQNELALARSESEKRISELENRLASVKPTTRRSLKRARRNYTIFRVLLFNNLSKFMIFMLRESRESGACVWR